MNMENSRYKAVERDLRKDILSGKYQAGTLLPSENQLCAIYNITRATVRQALRLLENDHYVVRKHGKGSIVAVRKSPTIRLLNTVGFSSVLSGKQVEPKSVLLECPCLCDFPEPFFYHLTDETRSLGAVCFRRKRCVEDKLMLLETVWMVNFQIPGFCEREFTNDSFFETLNVNYNVEVKEVEQELKAIPADILLAEAFGLKQGTPVLQINARFVTNVDRLDIYSTTYCDTVHFSIGTLNTK